MVKYRVKITTVAAAAVFVGLAGLTASPTVRLGKFATALDPVSSENPVLANTCLISNDVRKMADFYQRVLKITPKFDGESYAEFRTVSATLSIFDARAQEAYIPGSAQSSANRTAILEFRVQNVDEEYARLQGTVKT